MKKWLYYIVLICIGIGCVILIIQNHSDDMFFKANFIQVLTLLVATVLSFSFAQYLTDERRKKDYILHMLDDIQNEIKTNPLLFSNDKQATLLQTSIANKLKYIKEHGFKEISKEIDYIIEKFKDSRELYDNHKSTPASLQSIEDDLAKYKHYITTKCDKVQLKLLDL